MKDFIVCNYDIIYPFYADVLFWLCTSLNFVRETQTGFLQMLSIEHGESFTNMKSSFYDLSDDYTCHCSNSFDLPIISSLISTHVCLRFFFLRTFQTVGTRVMQVFLVLQRHGARFIVPHE